jgi:hypothetical protein
MQFCNNTTQIMVAFPHHMKQDTSVISILHCIKLILAVKTMTKKQHPQETLLPHTIMAPKWFLLFKFSK